MSGLKPITVNTAPEAEPNICAEDDAAIYQSIFGEDGVSSIGQACKATVLSNNKVRIADGVICVGGHFARIPYGDYIDCDIENGQSGKNRNDIIVARFETTGTGGIDTYTCEVKKGTPGTTATDPEITQEDLYKAGKVRELPLYRVKIEGLSIVEVEQLFTMRKTNEELEKELASLNSKIDYTFEQANSSTYPILNGYQLSRVGRLVTFSVTDYKKVAGRIDGRKVGSVPTDIAPQNTIAIPFASTGAVTDTQSNPGSRVIIGSDGNVSLYSNYDSGNYASWSCTWVI